MLYQEGAEGSGEAKREAQEKPWSRLSLGEEFGK